jgi:DNA processing protein
MVFSADSNRTAGGDVSDFASNLKYWLGFHLILGIGPQRLRKFIEVFGDVRSAWHASALDLEQQGISHGVAKIFLRERKRVDPRSEIERAEKMGVQLLSWDNPSYPPRLLEIKTAPPILYCRGEMSDADRWAVAIVGTRKISAYGRSVARELAGALAANGICVVSGLARGVDGEAHAAALDAGGRTLAVLGSGVDQIYPPEHRNLARRIHQRGAILSEYPIGTRPEGKNFPPRNRIISGLALIVVIVEAGVSSGALITADFAAEQGRDVFALPGGIYSPASKGTNKLIQSGAQPLLSVEDVLEALNLDALARSEVSAEVLPANETERLILDQLSSDPVHIDELGVRCEVDAATITSALAMLELKGQVVQVGGMQYIRLRDQQIQYRVE